MWPSDVPALRTRRVTPALLVGHAGSVQRPDGRGLDYRALKPIPGRTARVDFAERLGRAGDGWPTGGNRLARDAHRSAVGAAVILLLRRVFAHQPINRLTDQISMAGVTCVLLY